MSFVKLPILRHGLMIRHTDLLPDEAVAGRLEKARGMMSAQNVQSLLVYSDPTGNGPVCYLTHYPCFGLGRRATAVLGRKEGPFLFTAEPSRNLPRVRIMTTCDLEKTRQFLSAGCERAQQLAGNGRIGLVGIENLPLGLVKDLKGLSGRETVDLTPDFLPLMAAKDEGSLKATRLALGLAEAGIAHLQELASSGRDLWQMAADVDYRLRLKGCEDTNILLACSASDRLRPGYPEPVQPRPGEMLIAYVAVQYARYWGVAGTTVKIGQGGETLEKKLVLLQAVQNRAAAGIKAGMTLSQAQTLFTEAGRQAGLVFAKDMPLAAGVGFDLTEYPVHDEERLTENMVLQVALTVDGAGEGTAMQIGMLQIGESGGTWLTGLPRNS